MICVIIILIIFFSQIIINSFSKKNDNYMISEIDNLKNMMQDIKENFDDEKEKELLDQINLIYSKWKENEFMFSLFYEHDEIEKVSVALINLKETLYIREYNEGLVFLENYKFYINHFIDKNTLKFENIF